MSRAHRLAAIMFTDIQDYTKLMQEDEYKAIEIRDRHRDIFQGSMSKNGGEIIQYYGDGTLSIFESCLDAVRSAIEMQNHYQSDPVIPVRIGIHLGDIVLSDDDIIGDSVNLASRIESLGIPGSVLISQKVYDEIRNKSEFEVTRLGKFHFKNDQMPRTVYAMKGENLIVPKKHELQGKLETDKRAQRKKRIFLATVFLAIVLIIAGRIFIDFSSTNRPIKNLAVLPLNDRIGLSIDEAYIIEGLHGEIISKLSKAGLNVTPFSAMRPYYSSTNTPQNNLKTPEEIGQELNVDGLVEGSLFRSEDVYRIRVQIIDVSNQEYIAEPYEAEAQFASVMSIFTELVESIAQQISFTLSAEGQEYLKQNKIVNPAAYDLYLQGRFYLNKGSPQDLRTAIDLYNQALVIDPGFGDAHVSLVESYLLLGFLIDDPSKELDKFRYHLALASENDPFIARDPHLLAMDKLFDNWDWAGAAEELEKAMKTNPKSYDIYDSYCQLMWAMGDMDKSIAAGEKAVKLNPDAHYAHCDLAWAYYFDDQYEKAQRQVDKTIQKFGDCPQHNGLALLLDIDRKLKTGQSLITTIDRIEREIDSSGYAVYNLSLLGYAHALEGNREKALEILKECESKDISGVDKIYIALGDYDKAFEILDASVANRSFIQMYGIKQFPWFEPLKDDPRYERILTRMGLAEHQLNK